MAALAIALLVMLAWMIPMSLGGQANVIPNFGWWCLCGVLWGLGIIVPGMSPSNIFFFLGLATPMYASIGALDLGVILPMGVCLLLTVVLLSRGVGYCLKRWYSLFMHAVVGVVLASTVVILPPVKLLISPGYTFAMGLGDWLIYAGCFAAGAVLAWALGKVPGQGIKTARLRKEAGGPGALGQRPKVTWRRGQVQGLRTVSAQNAGICEGVKRAERAIGRRPPNLPNGFWTV